MKKELQKFFRKLTKANYTPKGSGLIVAYSSYVKYTGEPGEDGRRIINLHATWPRTDKLPEPFCKVVLDPLYDIEEVRLRHEPTLAYGSLNCANKWLRLAINEGLDTEQMLQWHLPRFGHGFIRPPRYYRVVGRPSNSRCIPVAFVNMYRDSSAAHLVHVDAEKSSGDYWKSDMMACAPNDWLVARIDGDKVWFEVERVDPDAPIVQLQRLDLSKCRRYGKLRRAALKESYTIKQMGVSVGHQLGDQQAHGWKTADDALAAFEAGAPALEAGSGLLEVRDPLLAVIKTVAPERVDDYRSRNWKARQSAIEAVGRLVAPRTPTPLAGDIVPLFKLNDFDGEQ